jgi:CO dehydrogenase maturation factor
MSRYLAGLGYPVLAIDADINQHLAASIGMPEDHARTIPALGLEMKRIKEFVRGDNPRIPSPGLVIKTTPPGKGSRLMTVTEQNDLYHYFVREHESIRLMAVGPFTEEDLGIRCYHSKTGSVELVLNHLIDRKNEYVLVDMTAGADSFASGLFTRFDITFLVVEPTLKSVSVYKQYKDYASEYGVTVRAIANKIDSDDDIAFICSHVGDDLAAVFRLSPFVRSAEKGRFLPFSDLEADNQKALETMRTVIDSTPKDWKRYFEQAALFHRKNAASWANAEMKTDLMAQIDPEFEYPV